MRRALVALGLAGLLVAGGCGRAQTPGEKALDEAVSELGRVQSGRLHLELVSGAGAQPGANEVGFALAGPFALPRPGALPVARIDYTRLDGARRSTVQLVATGRNAYVVLGGRTYALPERDLASLRAPAKGKQGKSLGDLDLRRWIADPKVADAGVVDGVPVERVTGRLRVVPALNDVFGLSRRLGSEDAAVIPKIEGEGAEQLERVVDATSVELLTGKRDRLLRRLSFDVRLEARLPAEVRRALGRLATARIRFHLGLQEPNRPVEVPEPRDPLPASSLPGG